MKLSSLLSQKLPFSSLDVMWHHFKAECDALDNTQDLFNLSALRVIQEDLLLEKGRVIAWKEQGQTQGAIKIPTDQGVYYWTHDGMLRSWTEMALHFEANQLIPKSFGKMVSDAQLSNWGESEALQIQTEKKICPLLRKQGLGMHFQLTHPQRFQLWTFVDTLAQYQCHPKVGQGIAQALLNTQERVTTTRYHLLERWDELESTLQRQGVTLSRTWPHTKPVTVVLEQGISNAKPLDEDALKSAISSLQGQYQRVKLR